MPKHASVYPRPNSPYWWVAYYSPSRRKRVAEATPYRKDDHGSKRKALSFAATKSQEAQIAKEDVDSNWENWVEPWLKLKHRSSPLSLQNQLIRWTHLFEYLTEKQIPSPRHMAFEKAMGYVEWRTSQVKKSSGRSPSYNTAIMELGLLTRVMREGVRRGHCDANPIERLGLKRDKSREKPEITDAEIKAIREALATRPEWMRVSFEIAIHQGCRLKETQVPMNRVDLDAVPPRIQFHAKQGKVFTTQLHPGLIDLMKSFKADGRNVTCEHPKMAAKEWHFFFREIGLAHLCFHCTRVTVVTRMARGGVPVQMAMAYVGHASEVIHKVYQRLKPSDVGPAIASIRV